MRVVVMLVLAGCGRIGFGFGGDPDATQPPLDIIIISDAPDPPRMATMVPGLTALPAGSLQLGATDTPTGFTLTWTAESGSDMMGVNLDATLVPTADWKVTSSGNIYTSTTMKSTGAIDPMTTMTTNVPNTFIKRYVADLSSYTQLDDVPGINAKPTYAQAANRWFYGVVDTAALHIHEMRPDGVPIGATTDLAGTGTAPLAGSLAGATSHLYVMWSNAPGQCRAAAIEISSFLTVQGSLDGITCKNPRLVAKSDSAFGVFDDGTSMFLIALTATGPDPVSLLVHGTNPRIAFEDLFGLWIAHRDASGNLAVARLPNQGSALIEVPITGLPTAAVDAYEFVQRANKTYLFVVANRGLWSVQLTP